jgi:aspartate racemase
MKESMDSQRTIGIVGGVGPTASLYTMQKVFDNTKTVVDQDHLPVILISKPEMIEDRSKFLLSSIGHNPGYSILSIIRQLEEAGADIIGIPCNTAHTEKIMSVIIDGLKRQKSKAKLLNIIDEVICYIKANWPERKKVGILATNGMYYDGEYRCVKNHRITF